MSYVLQLLRDKLNISEMEQQIHHSKLMIEIRCNINYIEYALSNDVFKGE